MSALIVDNGWQHDANSQDQEESHMTPINESDRQTISDLITRHHEKDGGLGPDRMLFTSKQGDGSVLAVAKRTKFCVRLSIEHT